MDDPRSIPCPVCDARTEPFGSKDSSFSGRRFDFQRCERCFFTFVSNPRLDFASVYDDRYYRGEGADPFVDYVHETEHMDRTIRRFEWRGVLDVVSSLVPVGPATRWLDYGCGTGGLVSYLRSHGIEEAFGYEEGWGAQFMVDAGTPPLALDDLPSLRATFDVVTLIEVLEHTIDPVAELERVRRALEAGRTLLFDDRQRRTLPGQVLGLGLCRPRCARFVLRARKLAPCPRTSRVLRDLPGLPQWLGRHRAFQDVEAAAPAYQWCFGSAGSVEADHAHGRPAAASECPSGRLGLIVRTRSRLRSDSRCAGLPRCIPES